MMKLDKRMLEDVLKKRVLKPADRRVRVGHLV